MTQVPKIEELKVNQILEEARGHLNIDEYMPDLHEGKLPYRDYVINIGKKSNNKMILVNTLLPNELQQLGEKAKAKERINLSRREESQWKYLQSFKIFLLSQKSYLVTFKFSKLI